MVCKAAALETELAEKTFKRKKVKVSMIYVPFSAEEHECIRVGSATN